MVMSKSKWYASNEHFNTEESYEEYLERKQNPLKKFVYDLEKSLSI